MIDGMVKLVPLGLLVEKSFANDLLGIPEPAPGAELLTAPTVTSPFSFPPSLNAQQSQARADARVIDELIAQGERLAGPGIGGLVAEVREIIAGAQSLQQVQDELRKRKPGIAEQRLAGLMQMVRVIANLSGRADITDA